MSKEDDQKMVIQDYFKARLEPRLCDRIYLYARGINVDPLVAVKITELVLQRTVQEVESKEAVQKLDSKDKYTIAFQHLTDVLDGYGLTPRMVGKDNNPFVSMPPMNRCRMIPENMNLHPFKTGLRRFFGMFFPSLTSGGAKDGK